VRLGCVNTSTVIRSRRADSQPHQHSQFNSGQLNYTDYMSLWATDYTKVCTFSNICICRGSFCYTNDWMSTGL